jgi:hypothetical protein
MTWFAWTGGFDHAVRVHSVNKLTRDPRGYICGIEAIENFDYLVVEGMAVDRRGERLNHHESFKLHVVRGATPAQLQDPRCKGSGFQAGRGTEQEAQQ